MLFEPWCPDCGCPPEGVPCGGCSLPKSDLTLTLTNGLLGKRTATLVFDGVSAWQTACVAQIVFILTCVGGARVFTARYYSSGGCPTGPATTCVSGAAYPGGLNVISATCDPLLLEYGFTNCPSLASAGYTKAAITL